MKRIIAFSLGGFFLAALVWFLFARHSGAGEPLTGISSDSSVISNEPDTLQVDVQAVADEYLNALNRASWSMELGQWIAAQGYKGAVDTAKETDATQWEFEKYCFKTHTQSNGCTTEYSFYDNGDYANPKAFLQQVVTFDRDMKPSGALTQQLWEAISNTLTKQYGAAAAVPEDHFLSPFDLGAIIGERKPQFWQDNARRMILAEHFRYEGDVRTDFIMLLSRAKALDSSAQRLQELDQKYDSAGPYGKGDIISEIRDSLRLTNSPLNSLCRSGGSPEASLDDLVHCAQFISTTEQSRDSIHLPLYRIALFILGQSYSPKGEGEVDALKRYNIVFEPDPLGEAWAYSKKPLVDIYTKYPGSRWGQLAFVLLQNTGWCMDQMCNGNKGPEVITKGQEFLRRYPKSTYAAAVLLTIGKGYETNWNISTCETGAEYMYDPAYRSDEDSRRKAIATYEQILTTYPGTAEAEIAKLRLPRLKLRASTGRADYFFIYD